nr:ORF1 [Rhodnius prolixus virus 6]
MIALIIFWITSIIEDLFVDVLGLYGRAFTLDALNPMHPRYLYVKLRCLPFFITIETLMAASNVVLFCFYMFCLWKFVRLNYLVLRKIFLSFVHLILFIKRTIRETRYAIWKFYSVHMNRAKGTFFEPESMRTGSYLFAAKQIPDFQGEVYIMNEHVGWTFSGSCFVAEGFLYTAKHVLDHAERVRIVKGVSHLDFTPRDFADTGMDLVYMPARAVQVLGFTHARFGELGECCMVSVTDSRQSSMGLLKPFSDLTYVEYSGSTLKGFSGAPYYMGNFVWGMHTGGGNVNLGFGPLSLQSAVKNKIYQPEATAEFLTKLFKRKNFKPKFKVSPFDPDELFVDIGHKQILMDRSDFFKIYTDVDEQPAAQQYEPETAFEAYQDSKNFVRELSQIPAAPVSKHGITLPQLVTPATRVSAPVMPKPKKTRRTKSAQQPKNWVFASPELTRAPLDNLLQRTARNLGAGTTTTKSLRRVVCSFRQLSNMGVLSPAQAEKCQKAYLEYFLDSNMPCQSSTSQAQPDVPTSDC